LPSLAVTALAVWAPGSPRNLWFGAVEFHQLWFENPEWNLRRFYGLMLRGFFENQGALILLGLGATLVVWQRRRLSAELTRDVVSDARWLGFSAASYLFTTAIHFSRPIAYPTYQTSNVVFLVVPSAYVWARWCARSARVDRVFRWSLLPLLLIGLPVQEWHFSGKGDGGLAKLQEASTLLRSLASGPDPIWTMSTELAVESGLAVLPGWEMSEFSWFRALLTTPEAQERHVVNEEMLAADLEAARPQLVCLTKRHLQMVGHPRLLSLLETRYEQRAEVSGYGQFHEPLYVFTRRKPL
jgi:hypothetical protein